MDGTVKKLFYVNVPSLENLSALNIIIQLWQNDLMENKNDEKLRIEMDGRLGEKAVQLRLATPLWHKVFTLIKQITMESSFWYTHHNYRIFENRIPWDDYKIMKSIVWSNVGTIKVTETVQTLINSSFLTVEERFCLACQHCMVNLVYELMSELDVSTVLGEIVPSVQPLVYFWACVVTGDMYKLNRYPTITTFSDSFKVKELSFSSFQADWNVNVKLVSSFDGKAELVTECDNENRYTMLGDLLDTFDVYSNVSAYMYFWKLLPEQRRFESHFHRGAKNHPHSLLPCLNEAKQREFFKCYGRQVLRDCLRRPLETEYMSEMLNNVTEYIYSVNFYGMLEEILMQLKFFRNTPAYYDYISILGQFFQRIPQDVRLFNMQLMKIPNELERSIAENEEWSVDLHFYVIKQLLNGASLDVQNDVFHSNYGKLFCMTAIQMNRWHELEDILPSELDLFDIPFTDGQLSMILQFVVNTVEESISSLEDSSKPESSALVDSFSGWCAALKILQIMIDGGCDEEKIVVVKSFVKVCWQNCNRCFALLESHPELLN